MPGGRGLRSGDLWRDPRLARAGINGGDVDAAWSATSTTGALFSNVVAGAELVNPGDIRSKLTNYIKKAAWSKAPAGTVGNSGRGMFRGRGTNLDSASFGQISGTSVNARLVQFALKLNF